MLIQYAAKKGNKTVETVMRRVMVDTGNLLRASQIAFANTTVCESRTVHAPFLILKVGHPALTMVCSLIYSEG